MMIEQFDSWFLPYKDAEHRYQALEEYVNFSEGENNEILTKFGQEKCLDYHSFKSNDEIYEDITYLHQCFEEGKISDEMLLQAICFNDYYLFLLLFLVITSNSFENEYVSKACECLVHISNIHDTIWNEFLEQFHHLNYHDKIPTLPSNTSSTIPSDPDTCNSHFLHILFLLIDTLIAKLKAIKDYEYPKLQTEVYIGYDERDAADYNTEGYQTLENEKEVIQNMKNKHEHCFEIFLLILYQIFYLKNDMIMIQIEENRLDLLQPTLATTTTNHHDRSIEEVVISKLLALTEEMSALSLSHNFQSNERITHLCLKIIILISSQFPLLNLRTTEIADTIVIMDGNNENGGMYAQGILVILNENGYPNMNMKEAFATIRFCINIFYSEANIMIQQLQSNSSDNDESVSHGNFYVNDIKVLLEICLRELINIPMESLYFELRLRYLELVQAILMKGDWSGSCHSYKRVELLDVLNQVKEHDIDQNQMLAEEIILLIEE